MQLSQVKGSLSLVQRHEQMSPLGVNGDGASFSSFRHGKKRQVSGWPAADLHLGDYSEVLETESERQRQQFVLNKTPSLFLLAII